MSAPEPGLEDALAQLQAIERVRAALERLGEAGPPSEIIDHAPAEAAAAVGLERVLLSRIEDGSLIAEALHLGGDAKAAASTLAELAQAPVRLDYPLVEAELLRRRRPLLVREADGGLRAHAEVMGWGDYVAAPVVLEHRVIGLLQGDRTAGALVELDRDALWRFSQGFADVFERAILRRRLRIQREELRQVASWADARTSELSDRAIELTVDRGPNGAEPQAPSQPSSDSRLRELLTRRELEVLEHMVRGETNAGIARELVVAEGTVKFHVKNILRKLHVSNRAEATARYLRLAYRRDGEAADRADRESTPFG
jgi:DNA-binding CsgD family transcriptional regulator